MLYTALLVFGLCGLVGVLVDLDHLANKTLDYTRDRKLHKYYLIVSCVVLSCCVSYLGGLLLGKVLG